MCFYYVNLSKISAAPASAAKKKERISTRQSVRRSARFLRDASFAESGSIFSVMDLPVLPAKIPRLALRKEPGSTMEADGTNSSSDINGLKVLNEIHSIPQGKKGSTKKRRLKAELQNSEEKENRGRIITKTNLEKKKRWKPVVSLMFEDELGFLLKDSLDAKTNETRWRQITPEPVEDKSSPCAEPNKERLINRQSSDISLPDCVRRSLTGEFVPGR